MVAVPGHSSPGPVVLDKSRHEPYPPVMGCSPGLLDCTQAVWPPHWHTADHCCWTPGWADRTRPDQWWGCESFIGMRPGTPSLAVGCSPSGGVGWGSGQLGLRLKHLLPAFHARFLLNILPPVTHITQVPLLRVEPERPQTHPGLPQTTLGLSSFSTNGTVSELSLSWLPLGPGLPSLCPPS